MASAQVEGGELSLPRAMKLAESFEMSRNSQDIVNSNGQLSRLSDHQSNKQDLLDRTPGLAKTTRKTHRGLGIVAKTTIHQN